MDPPPLSTAPPISTATATAAQAPHISYPNSVDSSPRSRTTDSWDEATTLPGGPPTGKIRLMCSYGGHIIPRPHDKTLCYIGGDTRIMVVDRHTTLSDLHNRLSKTLLNNKPFTLKYQLPNEDLDSLISVTTDEDLENMIDEYDRLFTNSGLKLTSYQTSKPNDLTKASPSRLRLFLFPLKSESSSSVLSIESLLESSTKSEDWFLDALNGNMRQSAKFSSDSSSVNCLLGLEDHGKDSLSLKDDKNQTSIGNSNHNNSNNNNGVNNVQDVHSVPDSPMLETSSSFGSTSSSPSMANLPPIRVHVEESGQGQKVGGLGIEEQFQQMSMGVAVGVGASPPAPVVGPVVTGMPAITGGGEYMNRVYSDDERSEQGLPVGYRKVPQVHLQVQLHQQQQQQHQHQQPPPTQQQPTQLQQKPSAVVELPSPDSVSSEGSVSNPLSRQRQMAYQEQIMQIQSANNRPSSNLVDPKISDPNSRVQMQQLVQESEYVMQGQFDQHPQLQQQQQFVHAGMQYIHHPHAPGGMPIASYYPVYPSQQQHHPHHHPAVEQQYVYYVPTRQAQAYNMPVQQQSYSESPAAPPSSRPQTPPPATMVNPAAAYNPAMNVPAASKAEMAPGIYRTSAAGAPHLVQVHSSQHQPQFVGYSQMHHPSQSVPPASGATANYAYEYADPTHAQIYYTQPIAPQLAAQYQTVTPAPAMMLPGTSQVPTENIKQASSNSQP